ncbi:kinase-like domain-containing protein [Sporodiniella umbellata]|nr:kinase-like domain-containing protein [Sporodiniella umbellata]
MSREANGNDCTFNRIAVIETKVKILNNSCTVYHILLENQEQHFSLVRHMEDFYELDNLLYKHFPKYRIPLPKLKSAKKTLGSLFAYKKGKENSELLQEYLYQSSLIDIGRTSLFRDFLSVQREEDRVISKTEKCQQQSIVQPTMTLKRKRSFYDSKQSKRPSAIETIQQFELIKVLGKGATGKVILVRRKQDSNRLFALKTINKSWNITTREVNHIKMERDILATLSELNHPFLIQLHWAFQDTQNLYLVLDYHAGADLATLLQRFVCFPQDQCRLYCAEIIMGLQELHRHCILYRDLKPENVLLASDGHIVLTDFGLSKMFGNNEEHRTTTYCGTPEYLAPEIILQEDEYSYAADYWSLGTMLYEMITGDIPFAETTPDDMYERVLYDDLLFPANFDPEAMDLIDGLLEKDPLLRLGTGSSGVFEIRTHPYFSNHLVWKDVYSKRISPPYVPCMSSETDLSNFDPDFLGMSITIKEESDDAVLVRQRWLPEQCPAGLTENAFRGYSFIQSNNSELKNESEFTFFGSSIYDEEDNDTYSIQISETSSSSYTKGHFDCRNSLIIENSLQDNIIALRS